MFLKQDNVLLEVTAISNTDVRDSDDNDDDSVEFVDDDDNGDGIGGDVVG